MIEYDGPALIRLAVLLCAVNLVFFTEQSDCDLVQTLDSIVEDKDFSKVISDYLDRVPSSHIARSHANRLISDHDPFRSTITTTTTTTTIIKKVTNRTINYSHKSYNNKLTAILRIIFALKPKKDEGCAKCEPCLPLKSLRCPETCNECKKDKCPPCKLPSFCEYHRRRLSKDIRASDYCPLEPVCTPCPDVSDSKSTTTSTFKPKAEGSTTTTTTRVPTKGNSPKPTIKPGPASKLLAKPGTPKPSTEPSSLPKPSAEKPSADASKPDNSVKPPNYIMEEVKELMKAEAEASSISTNSSSTDMSSETSTTTTVSNGKAPKVTVEVS